MSLLPPGPAAPAPIRALGAAVDWSVVIIGAVMVALVFANVVLHAFHRDNPWTTEFCEFLSHDEPVSSVRRLQGQDCFTETVPLLPLRRTTVMMGKPPFSSDS